MGSRCCSANSWNLAVCLVHPAKPTHAVRRGGSVRSCRRGSTNCADKERELSGTPTAASIPDTFEKPSPPRQSPGLTYVVRAGKVHAPSLVLHHIAWPYPPPPLPPTVLCICCKHTLATCIPKPLGQNQNPTQTVSNSGRQGMQSTCAQTVPSSHCMAPPHSHTSV